jgi:hypothetical protein
MIVCISEVRYICRCLALTSDIRQFGRVFEMSESLGEISEMSTETLGETGLQNGTAKRDCETGLGNGTILGTGPQNDAIVSFVLLTFSEL